MIVKKYKFEEDKYITLYFPNMDFVEKFEEINDHLTVCLDKFNYSIYPGIKNKVPDTFKDILKDIKKNHPKSNIRV